MIVAIVLAAGDASRYGSAKQLAELDGRPLLEHAVSAAREAPTVDHAIVVLGARAEEVSTGVDLAGTQTIVASDWADGMAASLRAGVAAASDRGADVALVLLGDQPLIDPALIEKVLADADPALPAARATYGGKPGHPVLIRRALFADVAALEGDEGARPLLYERGCALIECGGAVAVDVDTPADLERINATISKTDHDHRDSQTR